MFDSPRNYLVLLAILTPSTLLRADEPSGRPIVAGFERFESGASADPSEGGRLLIGELNCTSCHRGDEGSLAPVARKQAPVLSNVGTRVRVDHLRDYLTDPAKARPGSTMPNLLVGLSKEEADSTVDALVHFLASTGSVAEIPPIRKAVNPGKTLYEQSGCVACHGEVGDKEATGSTLLLGDLGRKYTVGSLADFVHDPLATRPSGRMPSMNFKPAEAQAVASFLLQNLQVASPANIAYRYYEGDWEAVPDFDKLNPVDSGMTEDFDLGVARKKSEYAVRFEGVLVIDRPGQYTFDLDSDDGSKLWIDDKLVVDNDGIHAKRSRKGRQRLEAGRHKVVVGFIQGSNEADLEVEYQGPGIPVKPLAPSLLPPDGSVVKPLAPTVARFVPDPSKAEKGRALFASIGCASCHLLKEGDKAIEPRPASKPLDQLKGDAGCLAAEPPKGVPHYGLSPRQRTSIAAGLRAVPRKPTDPEAIRRTLVAFNCYACHARDNLGGVEEARNESFATTQKEMGEEGRIPPSLTGVGGKLTASWLKKILADGAKDRPYMLTKMPKFGEGNVGHLAKAMEAVDLVAPVPVPHFDQPEKRVKATGRFIVGSQAFNCGSCHQFQEFQAAGIQALDMTLMTRRLRRDWFHRYVVDPQAFRPGTRMPTAWPGGKSQLEAILDGDTTKQVEAVWAYLSDGRDAAIPYGVGRDPIPLVADKGAVIYRNFISGAGPRAIGVGYPEKANLAFDANELRLALIWQGAFIDASKHWTGRGDGFQGPLGDNALSLPGGPSFATLPDPAAEWPRQKARELGQKFKGYRLAAGGKPVFQYEVGATRVEDFPEAVSGGDIETIRRTLDLAAEDSPGDLYFRAAVGKKITPLGDGWFQVDGEWKVRLPVESKPIVRESAGKAELIVPIKFEAGKARIVEEYAW